MCKFFLTCSFAISLNFFLAFIIVGESVAQDIWPQWRGPTRDSKITSSAWPSDLNEKRLAEAWTVPQQPSYSGPIVGSDRIFVTGTKDKKFEVVRALDRSTGEQIWETQWEGSMKVPFFAAANGSWIRATPAFDGERLFVAGMRDVLACLDAKTGKTRWTTKPFGKYWSMVASGDKILALDQNGELRLIQASPEEFKLVDRRQVADDSWAHLAVTDQHIFVRDLKAMKVFSWKP
jgi:outer membrane protein assembly factor BamB